MPLVKVVRSEAVKLLTLRGNLLALGASVVLLTGLAFAMARVSDGSSGQLAGGVFVAEPVALPMEYLAYVVMVLAVLVVTADLDVGTASVTAMVVPSRGRVIAGQVVVAVALGVLAALVLLPLVLVAAAWGGGVSLGASLDADGVLTQWVADAAAVPLAAVLGVAVGLLLRSTPLSLALLLLWSFAVETLLVFVVEEQYGAFLPFKTIGGSRTLMGELSPMEGLGVFAAYAAAALALAVFVTARRRDAVRA